MARVCEKYGGKLTTIEIDETRYNEALENFKKAGLNNVRAILGDAEEEIKKLNEEFDFVFIDASKGHYKQFFEDSYKLLKKDGIIFIDNIMFRGYLYKEYPKRFKTIVRKLDEFITWLYDEFEDRFVLLPFGDKRFKTIVRKLDEFITWLYDEFEDRFVLLPFGDGIGLLKK